MDLFSLQTILLFLLVSLHVYFFLRTTHPRKKPMAPKGHNHAGFRTYPLVGSLPEFLRNRHRFLDWMTEVLRSTPGNTCTFWRPGKLHGVITANPAVVEYMLKTNFENYPKGDRFITLLGDFLGRGIFNSDGELWKIQRKTASYEFNTKSLRNFVMENVIVEIQTRLVPVLSRARESNCVLDLQDALERFAFDNICKLAFNVDPVCLSGDVAGEGDSKFMCAFEDAAMISSERFMYAFPASYRVKKLLNVGSERRLRESISTVHAFAERIIRSRMEEKRDGGNRYDDLLSRFIGSESSDSSTEFLRDIVISFILAGRDTTSAALSWFFWLLSRNARVEQEILKELEKLREIHGKKIGEPYSFDELRDMHYLHAAISEAMRLYPPVPVDTKACLADDILPDGTFIGRGWFISYDTYAMGRMESVWGENCREFLPERWIDENGSYRPESPFKYPVFHAGPRVCLGKDMAYIQMKSIAASVLERFEIDVQDKDMCPEQLLSLTLRMKGGLPVRVKPRAHV